MTNQTEVEQSSPPKYSEIKKNITNVISGILDSIDSNAKKSILYEELLKYPGIFKSPDSFYHSFYYNQENAIRAALSTIKELHNNYKSEEYCHIFLNHGFYESHIERLVTAYEGSVGCADKSGSIVGRYLILLRTGEKVKWEADEKGCYWLPTFGTQDDWYQYMNALHYLYFGHTDRYLEIYQKLIKLGKERREQLLSQKM